VAKRFAVFCISVNVILGAYLIHAPLANAQQGGASLFLRPASGSYIVNNTFDVSVVLNTNGQSINAVDVNLKFPPDKLQVVSPSLGQSIVGVWVSQPTFNNQTGTIRFQGGIPSPGINTSSGIISTITFRVKSIGTATVTFSDESKVLLNDGLGTNILTNKSGGIFNLVLPPPAGPTVISPTHPDGTQWNKNTTALFDWVPEGRVTAYSYILNNEPVDTPDDISESTATGVAYKNLEDGLYYFHIKALRDDAWGGVTHFAVKIDSTPPAEFKVDIVPGARTTSKQPIINLATTDNLSGIDHYELKIVPLDIENISTAPEQSEENFFIETESRYISEMLNIGKYDVIIRAFDRAGNIREVTQQLSIVNPLFSISDSGLGVTDNLVIPWVFVLMGGTLLVLALSYGWWLTARWRRNIELRHLAGALNDPTIRERLKYLEEKQKAYVKGMKAVLVFFLLGGLLGGAVESVKAQSQQNEVPLPPPIITSISKHITNEDVFYVGGRTEVSNGLVTIYVQSLKDGQITSTIIASDKKGDWFYTRPELLVTGNYLLWTQLRIGNEESPPGPQQQISVSQTAFQVGASRLSYETLYLLLALILFIAAVILGGFVGYNFYHGRKKHKNLLKEVREAEEAIKRGFIVLHRDIEQELSTIHKAKFTRDLSEEEKDKEKKMLKDLELINDLVTKEVHDIRKQI